jgi:hypothetical protein
MTNREQLENKLQENFSYRGFRFTQVEREKNIAIYLMENDVPIESKDYYFCYEVIKIKKQKAHSTFIEGKEVYYPEKEVYPNDKSWGLSGWTFKDISEAKAYFINLSEKVPHSSQATVKTEDLTLTLT